jgi:NAD(P)-dependent dehydrogenase (short-subunit alcohol dehydrogenase family)
MDELRGKVAVITGSTGDGIGRSSAFALARKGANVVLNYGTGRKTDQHKAEAERVRAELANMGSNCALIEADTKTNEGVRFLIASALEKFGTIDILVNNAGAPWLEEDYAASSAERWDATIAAEITGPCLLIKEALPHMREKRWGRIVNIIIDFKMLDVLLNQQYAHILSSYPYPFYIGKSGRYNIAKVLSHSELKNGITINNVLPGIIEEISLEQANSNSSCRHENELINPNDVADIICLLCSDLCKNVTGSDIVMPGNVYSRIR